MQLDGKSDECPQQTSSQFLVIRNLPSSISETTLATGVKKLYVAKEEPKQPAGAPTKLKSTAPVGNTSGLGAKPGSLARIFIIRERYSDVSCRYGFAEFSTIDDARAAMAKFNASPQFTIGSKPVTVAYIHSGVFIPYLKPITNEQENKFTFAASHNPSLRLSYWNPTVYASEFTVFNEGLYEEKPTEQAPAADSNSAAKDSKKRKADKELAAPGGKKTIAMAPQLARWANKHAELRGSPKNSSETGADDKSTPATGPNSLGGFSEQPAPASSAAASVSYADLDQMCCLLCRRKFVSDPSLRRHEQLSDLHKKNLNDDALIEKATKDLKARGKEPTSNYRDRAKERRLAYNQPNKPKPHVPRKHHSGPKDEAKEAAPAKPTMSKGAGLLAKMGWNAGAGLGAEGDGRTNIVETMAYTPGVGLGAEGGKIGDAAEEAARATRNDYADFVAKAKDKARQRYEKMD
jgi:RNA-binding protein 5/10